MTNEQMRVELPELPRPDKVEQDMDVNLGRVEYRYFCEDATTAYATAAILADRERRAAKDAGDGCDEACMHVCTKGGTQVPECATPPQPTSKTGGAA